MISSARRCLALPRGALLARVPLPATRALQRPPRNGSLVRCFSAESSSDGGADTGDLRVQKDLYHIGTVTTKRPGDTDLRSLIERIPPVPYLMPHFKSPTAMLLVTPSFAAALQPPSDGSAPEAVDQVLSRILDHSLDHASPLQNIRIVAAVVDRLPVPRNDPETSKGCEGLAYALWYSDHVTQKNWTKQPKASSQDDSVGRLTFDIWDRFRLTDLDGKAQRDHADTIHRLHLPLANTVFQTGHTSIMYNILYKVSEVDELVEGAPLFERRSLYARKVNRVKYQRVTWPVSGRYLAHEKKFFPSDEKTLHQLQLNLIPLTAPRQVHAGMGNIIRQIAGSDEKPAPASQELEKAVSSYFTATGQAPHPMPVWAIVCNERSAKYFSSAMLGALGKYQPQRFNKDYNYAGVFSEYVQDTWSVDPEQFNYALWKHILLGNAKVHRVLSGGGGWGKKAGLLSLDPNRSYERGTDHVDDTSFSASFVDGDSSMGKPLAEVAKPGSYIQFFVSPVSSLNAPGPEHGTCAFGVIPSTIDDIPVATPEGPSGIDLWRGYFGALSEQGMSMKFVRHLPGKPEHFSQTMVDVPFSLFVTKPRLPTLVIPAPSTEYSARTKSKFSSANNQGNVTRTHGLETNPRRSLHTQAKPVFDPPSRRYFSSSSVLMYPKSKDLERMNYGRLRPCVPISRRLRTIKEDTKRPDHWSKTIELQKHTGPNDLKLTLDEYKHYWKFTRWIAAHCQAQLDARPPVSSAGKPIKRGPVHEERMLWKGYLEAANTHSERLREQNFRLLESRVEAVEAELKHCKGMSRIILEKAAGSRRLTPNPVGAGRLRKIWSEIKVAQVAVAPLPFRAKEVVGIFEQMGHKSQLKCKKWEDTLYAKVLHHRRKMRKMRERLSRNQMLGSFQDIGGFESSIRERGQRQLEEWWEREREQQLGAWEKHNPASHEEYDHGPSRSYKLRKDRSDSGIEDLEHATSSSAQPPNDTPESTAQQGLTIQPARPIALDRRGSRRVQVKYGKRPTPGHPPPTHSQRRHLSWLRMTPDPAAQRPTTATTTPVEPATVAPTIHLHPSTTARHHARAPSARALFARERRVRRNQLSLLRRSLARLARAELAYLDQSVYLSRLALIRLTQQAVAIDPAAFPVGGAERDEWLQPPPRRFSFNALRNGVRERVVEAAREGSGERRELVLGAVGDEVDVMEAQIGRLKWSVRRLGRRAVDGVGEAELVALRKEAEGSVEIRARRMAAFRELRQRLVEGVGERLRSEERGWRKRSLIVKMGRLRAAEIWYLKKVVDASERELQVAEEEFGAVLEEIDEEQARRRRELKNKEGGARVGQNVRLVAVRNTMDDVMEKRAAEAWALAKDLEEFLAR